VQQVVRLVVRIYIFDFDGDVFFEQDNTNPMAVLTCVSLALSRYLHSLYFSGNLKLDTANIN